MLEKERLRKADVFSGIVVFLFGAWVVRMAFKMPMKDSWGGVQNVWFVSPALFPLCVGTVIMILGLILSRTALKMIGFGEVKKSLRWLTSSKLVEYLTGESILRFYMIAVLFLSFVFINISRIDFFLCSVLFLVVFITTFYFDVQSLFKKYFAFYVSGTILLLIFFATGLHKAADEVFPYAADLLALVFIIAYCLYVRATIRDDLDLRKKFRSALIVALVAPFFVGPIFKYFLLVPLPHEGMIVAAMDYLYYLEFLG